MRNLLKFDLFSKTVEISLDGEDSSRSYIGAFVSVICLALSFGLTYESFNQFVNKVDPDVSSYIEYDTTKINMTEQNFFFAIGFFSQLQGKPSEISNSTNNYTDFLNLKDIDISCPSCNFSINNDYYETIYGQKTTNNTNRNLETTDSDADSLYSKSRAYLSPELIPDYAKYSH